MLHEEFAERVAGRLEARVEILENGGRPGRHRGPRQGAAGGRGAGAEAASVSLEEAPPPEAQA